MDQKEFLKVTVPFKDKVFRLVKILLISTEEAQDPTQEVCAKLWSNE
jgi:RNA polymerase sigma-70 factor (ECF subfamily)